MIVLTENGAYMLPDDSAKQHANAVDAVLAELKEVTVTGCADNFVCLHSFSGREDFSPGYLDPDRYSSADPWSKEWRPMVDKSSSQQTPVVEEEGYW